MHVLSTDILFPAKVWLPVCSGLEDSGRLWGLLQEACQVALSLVCQQVLHCMAHIEQHKQQRPLQRDQMSEDIAKYPAQTILEHACPRSQTAPLWKALQDLASGNARV